MALAGVHWRSALSLACLLAATGCIADQDGSAPEIVIELFWEDGSDGERDDGETCETAGVATISWRLLLEDGDFDEVIAEGDPDEACVNTLGFGDIPPGRYRLELGGSDPGMQTQWRGICDELFVDRFDELYGCQVFLVDDDSPAAPSNPGGRRTDGGRDSSANDASVDDASVDGNTPDAGVTGERDAGADRARME